MMPRTKPRPLLRWHGGKWMLAPWIVSHFPPHRCYVEPFGGAASVLLRKPRAYTEVYNNLDTDIVNLFHIARDRGPQLARAWTRFDKAGLADGARPRTESLWVNPAATAAQLPLFPREVQI